jgi:hypothetical protein
MVTGGVAPASLAEMSGSGGLRTLTMPHGNRQMPAAMDEPASAAASERKPDPSDWFVRLESQGAVLLGPFTTEATRKTGFRLVLVATLTVVLALDVVVVTEGSLAGIKVQAAKVSTIVALAALACLYLLVLYAVDLFRDWKASYYKRLPAMKEYSKLLAEFHRDNAARLAAHRERDAEIDRLIELRKAKRGELLAEFERDKPELASAVSGDFPDLAKLKADHERHRERMRRTQEYWAYCTTDGLEALEKLHLREAFDNTLAHRIGELAKLAGSVRLADYLRLGTEVLIPCGLAVCALPLAAWRVFH